MTPEMVTALGGVVLGLAPIAAGLAGKRGATAARAQEAASAQPTAPDPAPPDPAAAQLNQIIEQLQEERNTAHTRLAELEQALRQVYALLDEARTQTAEARVHIVQLTGEVTMLRQKLGGGGDP